MAAVALGRAASAVPPDDRAVLELARLLAEDDRERRVVAASVLVGLGPRAYAAGPALVAAVRREAQAERDQAGRDPRPAGALPSGDGISDRSLRGASRRSRQAVHWPGTR